MNFKEKISIFKDKIALAIAKLLSWWQKFVASFQRFFMSGYCGCDYAPAIARPAMVAQLGNDGEILGLQNHH